jgi:uncharacterized protein (TIGR02466 family)
MELLDKQMVMLFPTPVFAGKISDITACDRIEKKLREMQKAGEGAPHKWGKKAFFTKDNIHTLPEMKELVDLVMKESKGVLDEYKMKRDSHYITCMWANITPPNNWHHMHIHANSLFSGILNIKTPANCGATFFQDPRLHMRMIEPTYSENNVLNSTEFHIPPQKGLMLMWPSYLTHAVQFGTADENEDRIVVSFNIMIRGYIDRRTAVWDLR